MKSQQNFDPIFFYSPSGLHFLVPFKHSPISTLVFGSLKHQLLVPVNQSLNTAQHKLLSCIFSLVLSTPEEKSVTSVTSSIARLCVPASVRPSRIQESSHSSRQFQTLTSSLLPPPRSAPRLSSHRCIAQFIKTVRPSGLHSSF